MKKFLTVAALVALSAGAQAGVTDLPYTTSSTSYSFSSLTKDSIYKLSLGAGEYLISYSFTGTGQTSFAGGTTYLSTNKNGSNHLDDGVVVGQTVTGSETVKINGDRTFFLMIDALKAGNTGYGGTITVTAVPEPASTALFLAGLGALGLLARRRRS